MPNRLQNLFVLNIFTLFLTACNPGTEKVKEVTKEVKVPEVKTVEVPVQIPGTSDRVMVPQVVQTDRSVGIRSLPLPIAEAPESLRRLSKALVKIQSIDSTGSGFFISADGLLLTNEHVIPLKSCANKRCPGFKIISDFHENGEAKTYTDFEVLAQRSGEFDFTLIKVKLRAGERTEFLQLDLEDARIETATEASRHVVLGHPHGAGLRYAEAKILKYEDHNLVSQGLVISGNSGGPLIDLQTKKVVGLVKSISQSATRNRQGGSYIEHLSHSIGISKLNQFFQRAAGQPLLSALNAAVPESLNPGAAALRAPVTQDFKALLRRQDDDAVVEQTVTAFQRLIGTEHEADALALMMEKTEELNGKVSLENLQRILQISLMLGRSLRFTPAHLEELDAELAERIAQQEQREINAAIRIQINLHYFNTEKRRELLTACLQAIPDQGNDSLVLATTICQSDIDRRGDSVWRRLNEELTNTTRRVELSDISLITGMMIRVSPFVHRTPENLRAISEISSWVNEKTNDLRNVMSNDGWAMSILKNQVSVGSFKDTFP